jgi:heme-degrading monooxygenase HmoA
MYLRISWGSLKPGAWSDYESTHRRVVPPVGAVKGLKGRIVARDVDREDTGYSISFWESLEEMHEYESGSLTDVMSALKPFFSGKFSTHRCEVRDESGISLGS